jgi:hypothetical protein
VITYLGLTWKRSRTRFWELEQINRCSKFIMWWPRDDIVEELHWFKHSIINPTTLLIKISYFFNITDLLHIQIKTICPEIL